MKSKNNDFQKKVIQKILIKSYEQTIIYGKEDFMSINFCIIGGDLRSFFLAKILSREKYEVKLYGFDKLENFKECEKYSEMIRNSHNVVLPIPFSKDNQYVNLLCSNKDITIKEICYYLENKTIFVGNIQQDLKEELHRKNNKVIDFMQQEEFAILNTIPTAEATIEIIIKNTKKILQNSSCLIMGFGRIGKVLAYKLKGLSAKITCMTIGEVEKAWAVAYGYETTKIESLQKNCTKFKQYDIIINTIPKVIFKEELKEIKKETLIIDLASKPYGIDRKIVEQENLNFIEALGLPRKIGANDISKIYERYNKAVCIKRLDNK